MTAEIAVMNKQAVALAADSAVTIGVEQKIYNTANKLFMLSKYAPVGAMVYGGAEFMRVPWETIVKCYRSELGASRFQTLDEYAEHFRSFLCGNAVLFGEDRKFDYLIGVLSEFLTERANEFISSMQQHLAQGGVVLSEESLQSQLDDYLDRCLAFMEKCAPLEAMPRSEVEGLVRQVSGTFMDSVFENFPVSDQHRTKLSELCLKRITHDFWGDAVTGLVIAGFGEHEIYPAIRDLTVELSLGDSLRWKLAGSHDIRDDSTACIRPFAQGEMVRAFMEGSDPAYREYAEGQLDRLFEGIPERLVEKMLAENIVQESQRSSLLEALGEDVRRLLERFKHDLQVFQQESFVHKTMNVVSALPKEELAEMAETLVSLTSFKRRMSLDVETVGGPVDVAVISKGDGFIWVKRKHYFLPELNHGFFEKYYHDFTSQSDRRGASNDSGQ